MSQQDAGARGVEEEQRDEDDGEKKGRDQVDHGDLLRGTHMATDTDVHAVRKVREGIAEVEQEHILVEEEPHLNMKKKRIRNRLVTPTSCFRQRFFRWWGFGWVDRA